MLMLSYDFNCEMAAESLLGLYRLVATDEQGRLRFDKNMISCDAETLRSQRESAYHIAKKLLMAGRIVYLQPISVLQTCQKGAVSTVDAENNISGRMFQINS